MVFIYRIALEHGSVKMKEQRRLNIKVGKEITLFAVHENIDIIFDVCLILFVVMYGWFGLLVI